MARPQKLNEKTQAKIYEAIRLGATYEAAAGYAGIHAETLLNWRKKGAEQKSGQYVDFLAGFEEAEAAAQVGWLAKIEAAANDGAWQAAAWKLERRYPNTYGRTVQQMEHSGKIGVDVTELSDEELERIVSVGTGGSGGAGAA